MERKRMMEDIKKSTEGLNDDSLDGVSGGHGGHIEYIICPTCGYEIRLKGWYTNICPRCKAIVMK